MGPRPHQCGFFHSKRRALPSRITKYSMNASPSSVVLYKQIATLGLELQVSVSTRQDLSFCACKTTWLASEILVSMGPSPHLWILHCKTAAFSIRITKSLWVPDRSLVAFCASKIAVTLGHQNYKSPRVPDLTNGFLHSKQRLLASELLVSMGPKHYLTFCAFKTAWLAPEKLVSMGPSPHLWFLHAKQQVLDLNSKSLCVPDHTCRFVHAKHSE